MKIAVIGSRSFDDYPKMKKVLDSLKDKITGIVSGGAKGADSLAEKWASENDVPIVIFFPNWDKYGKKAAMIRNKLIIDECDQVVAFWDGKSPGTRNSLSIARIQNKKYFIVPI